MDKLLEWFYNNDLNLDNANVLYHKAKKLDNNIKLNDVKEVFFKPINLSTKLFKQY